MTFNETFLRTRDKMFFTGYQPMARADRLNIHGGGVAILVRNGINFGVVNPIPTSGATSNEQLTITIQTTTGTHCTVPKGGPQEKSFRGSVWGGTTSYLQATLTANMRVLETALELPVVTCHRIPSLTSTKQSQTL